ncbi:MULTISPECIES: ribonuclease D [unclassified Acinetobacter]|uniref:ribonuclease D n=1 Tax=unclassified Acinetobacter TaxID=196816 RepID=UPI0029347DBB|nr:MULTISPECIES: HRDC domain-containing protein [unclassified Acinetobacter]WOE31930.1 HRDC domain-containing protein [Acinetobacter sp. SAAs470]WOE37397.1 HRDC domain-containing protein [Acinetobacter sp. SAAs474]
MFQFIDQQSDFNDVCTLMSQCTVYGLDTEFIKVDTLWPKLGIFQINIAGKVFLLDGTKLDLSEFWQRLFNAQQNVFHACSEDLDLIYHYAKRKHLKNVFDTQVALSFLGQGLQVSYQNALKNILDIEIEKDQTRSDWLARPLTTEQLQYAANDVVYIMQLADEIKKRLIDKSLLGFVEEDCQYLAQEIGKETPTELLYSDVANYRHSRRQLMQLQQLAVWREQMAKHLNQPRSFILKNVTMIDLVEKNPKNHFQLTSIKNLRPNIIRDYGKIILDLLRCLPEQEQWPAKIVRPIRPSTAAVVNKIETIIQKAVDETAIPREVLLRKKWLNSLYQHVVFQQDEQDLPHYLLGWRYTLLTQPLIQTLSQNGGDLSV